MTCPEQRALSGTCKRLSECIQPHVQEAGTIASFDGQTLPSIPPKFSSRPAHPPSTELLQRPGAHPRTLETWQSPTSFVLRSTMSCLSTCSSLRTEVAGLSIVPNARTLHTDSHFCRTRHPLSFLELRAPERILCLLVTADTREYPANRSRVRIHERTPARILAMSTPW